MGLWSCSKSTDIKSLIVIPDSSSTIIKDTRSITQTVDTTSFDYDSFFKLESYITKDEVNDGHFEVVDFDCAILIYPTHEQIDEMKKEEGEEDFYIGADDSNWYQAQAIQLMDSVGIKQITATGQFLRLNGKQQTWDLDIRKKNLPAWNLIFFNTTKEPKIISTVDVTFVEIKKYFEK